MQRDRDVVAKRALVKELQAKAGNGQILPARTLLNVNFPNNVSSSNTFAFEKMGTYDAYMLKFNNKVPYGITGARNGSAPNATQQQDEILLAQNKISVTVM